ncbi:type II toxin-antitoxin system VapC family toxin [Halococcoides cellulosivorans]|uniref:PIN domain-containing protein n=1 Tax=Halococcoides cellulosivorans TaxID=1679096 RepID=A0A2R4X422_9EURY|nr:type II toxin-antitoxin system VapC family toxin [Halococcoides cellulosivorans]AWB28538.1 PIN domain-containing protein [Halococcoides cellulosivorans]
MRVLPDVNALAIQLVEDHPGHPSIAEALAPALRGPDTLVVFGYQPLRVQWILEDLGVSTIDARNAVGSLLQYPMENAPIDAQTIMDAYEISSEYDHDVYDCFYLALARQIDADRIVTTDRDFAALCADGRVEYHNPVPEDVLTSFDTAGE